MKLLLTLACASAVLGFGGVDDAQLVPNQRPKQKLDDDAPGTAAEMKKGKQKAKKIGKSQDWIEGCYIVQVTKFKGEDEDGKASKNAEKKGKAKGQIKKGKVVAEFENAFVVCETDEKEATSILSLDDVEFVDEEILFKVSTYTWGRDRINQYSSQLDFNVDMGIRNGQGVHIYIVDTGIEAGHTEFSGRVQTGVDCMTGRCVPGQNDCDGHGTHCAGTAAGSNIGVAPGALLFPVKVFGCDGRPGPGSIFAGMQYVMGQKRANPSQAMVMSLSIGTDGRATSTLYAAIMDEARGLGIVVVVAAGNNNDDACYYPFSRGSAAITVGAMQQEGDQRSYFSNFGGCVDIFAPGSDVWSSVLNNGYASKQGTSMACPHVAGMAALILSAGTSATPQNVEDTLFANAGVVIPGQSQKLARVDIFGESSPISNCLISASGHSRVICGTASCLGCTDDADCRSKQPSLDRDKDLEDLRACPSGTVDEKYQKWDQIWPAANVYLRQCVMKEITTSWKYFNAGDHRALLTGPGRDMDMFLNKWEYTIDRWQWNVVASATSSSSNEIIKFTEAGYYSITIENFCCATNYDLCVRSTTTV